MTNTFTVDDPLVCRDCRDPLAEHCCGHDPHCACSCREWSRFEHSITARLGSSGEMISQEPRYMKGEKLLAALIAIDIARIAGNRDATAQDFVDLARRIVERVLRASDD